MVARVAGVEEAKALAARGQAAVASMEGEAKAVVSLWVAWAVPVDRPMAVVLVVASAVVAQVVATVAVGLAEELVETMEAPSAMGIAAAEGAMAIAVAVGLVTVAGAVEAAEGSAMAAAGVVVLGGLAEVQEVAGATAGRSRGCFAHLG